ncbi:MAG: NnrS family protein [Burkholderiales bacterium]
MSELLGIEEPRERQRAGAPDWRAFLELGFRPLYLAGTAWALLSIGLWIFAPQWIGGTLGGLAWHAHEALWGFVATIAVGFLLTAGANWTGINPLSGTPLALLCALWLVARIGYLVPQPAAFWIAAVSESLFFLIAAVALLRAVHKGKNQRNYGVPWLLMALGVANGLYLDAARGGDFTLLMQRFDLGLLCMALIALLVARRVIPFFAMRAVPGLQVPMHTRSGQVQLMAGVAAIGCALFAAPELSAVALAIAGALAWGQVLAWKPLAVRRNPLLWILYAGYAALGGGLFAAAAHMVGWIANPALHVHLIAVGGFGLLIIGMVTRTALGHLGLPLALDGSMRASYWLMIAAALLRLAAIAPSLAAPLLLQLSATCWVAAFALYLWRFGPLLIRPRIKEPAPMPTVKPSIKIAPR